jgi:glycosyltransferase involved in cell wall biosynthesis
MVTTQSRKEHQVRAIKCFVEQTFVDKELIIVTDNMMDKGMLTPLQANGCKNKILYRPFATIGEKRNVGISYSKADYIATWDDDDWNHPIRLTEQLRAMTTDGSILDRVTLVNSETKKYAISKEGKWQASFIGKRLKMFIYPAQNFDEDEAVTQRMNIGFISNKQDLFHYHIHGKNTWWSNERFIEYSDKTLTCDKPEWLTYA